MAVRSATQTHHLSLPPTRFIKIMHKLGELALRIGEMIHSLFQKVFPFLFDKSDKPLKTSFPLGSGTCHRSLSGADESQHISSTQSLNSLPDLVYPPKSRLRCRSLERLSLAPPPIPRLPSMVTYSNLPGLLFSHVSACENPPRLSESSSSASDVVGSHSRGVSDISMSSVNVQIIMEKARLLAAAKKKNSLSSGASLEVDYKTNGTTSSTEEFNLLGRLPSPQNTPPASGTFFVRQEMGTQHVDLSGKPSSSKAVAASPPKSERTQKKKIDLISGRKKCDDFEPLHVVGSKGLKLEDLSAGIYCALKAIECLWSRIIQDPNIQPKDLEEILDGGISLCKEKGDQFEKPQDLFVHFPSIREALFTNGILKVPKYPTQLMENGELYGNSYKKRILEEIEQIHAIAEKNPQHLAAALFLKGHKSAQEAFVIFAYRPPKSADRYYLLDLGAAVGGKVSFESFPLRAYLRDHLIARVPASNSDDQENDLYQFIALKVV